MSLALGIIASAISGWLGYHAGMNRVLRELGVLEQPAPWQ